MAEDEEYNPSLDDSCALCVCDGAHEPTWSECSKCDCIEYVPMWALEDDDFMTNIEDSNSEEEFDEVEEGETSSPKSRAPGEGSSFSSEPHSGRMSKQCAGPCGRIKLLKAFGSTPDIAYTTELCVTCRTGDTTAVIGNDDEESMELSADYRYSENDYEADLAERWQEDHDRALSELTEA